MIFNPFTIAHVRSLVIIIVALLVNRKIKNGEHTKEEIVANNTAVVGFADYSLIIGIVAVGTWLYYFIH